MFMIILGVCLIFFGVCTVLLGCGLGDGDGFLDRVVFLCARQVPVWIYGLLHRLGATWVFSRVGWVFSWLLNKPHPLVQIMYLGIVCGAFYIFTRFGFPDTGEGRMRLAGLSGGMNPYFAAHHVTEAYIIMALVLLSFMAASFLNPGVVTKDNVEACKARFPYDNFVFRDKECPTCKLSAPARSKHCSVCDRCVSKFDHHCIWLNNCVGERNYRWFLLFLYLNTVLMVYGIWATTSILLHDMNTHKLLTATFTRSGKQVPATYFIVIQYLLGTRTEVCMVGALCVVMGLLVGGFFVYHACLAATNTTTNESVKWGNLSDYRDYAVAEYNRAKKALEGAEQALEGARKELEEVEREGGGKGATSSSSSSKNSNSSSSGSKGWEERVKAAKEKVAAMEKSLEECKRPPRRRGVDSEPAEPPSSQRYELKFPEPMPTKSLYNKGLMANLAEMAFPPSK